MDIRDGQPENFKKKTPLDEAVDKLELVVASSYPMPVIKRRSDKIRNQSNKLSKEKAPR
jgi:hypothetical protein